MKAAPTHGAKGLRLGSRFGTALLRPIYSKGGKENLFPAAFQYLDTYGIDIL